jgi:type 1 fimbria pilin
MRNKNKYWLVAALLACLFFSLTTGVAHASANGSITGQLVNGTHKNAALANQTVTLQMAQGQSSKDLTTAKTDAHGQFSFAGLDTDKTISYAVYIRFQGAQYTSDIVTLDSKPQQNLPLVVYDATTDSSKLVVIETTILIQQPDPRKNTLNVSEIVGFRNLDIHTYVGSLDASKGKPNALLFALPPNVKQVSLDKGFEGYQQILVDKGFAADAAVPPGISEFGFSYQLTPTTDSYDFSFLAVYPTVDLSILVPPSLQVSSGSLAAKGLVNADQSTYQMFKTSTLRANDDVHLNIEGLPAANAPSDVQPASFNTTILWLAASILLMLFVLFSTWMILRRRREQAVRSRVAAQSGKHSSGKILDVKDERQQELLDKLLNLDKDFEAGEIKKAAYQEQRAKVKAQLRGLLREQESVRR